MVNKKKDGILVAALLVIALLIMLTIIGCNTVNGIGRDIVGATDPYIKNQQPRQ